MTENEVRDFFQCVRETPKTVLRERLHLYKSAINALDRIDLEHLIAYCEKNFPYLFKGGRSAK